MAHMGSFVPAEEADVWDGSQKGVLYGGIRHESEEKFLQFGIFAGRDFTHDIWRAGAKIGKSFGPSPSDN